MERTSWNRDFSMFWRTCRRTTAEQCVGFGIALLFSLSFALLGQFYLSQGGDLPKIPWSLPQKYWNGSFVFAHLTTALAFWALWRKFSLSALKLELALFFSGLVLESLSFFVFFRFHQKLLSLFLLLLWLSCAICATALFWKKVKWSGPLLAPILLWNFYLITIHMMLCIANP